jgi:hypothetical protein
MGACFKLSSNLGEQPNETASPYLSSNIEPFGKGKARGKECG